MDPRLTPTTETEARAALLRLRRVGHKTVRKLAQREGGAVAAFSLLARGLKLGGVGPFTPVKIEQAAEAVSEVRRFLEKGRGRAVAVPHELGYPAALLELSDAPALVFTQGLVDISPLWPLLPSRAVAIVGTRQASSAGLAWARELANALTARGIVVVSGGAEGVDQAAHEGAMAAVEARAAGGPGVAGVLVAGGGLNQLARDKRSFAAGFVEVHGVTLSRELPDDPAGPGAYQRRNSLIAALAAVTVVVEGAIDSGALITAAAARSLRRPVAVWAGALAGEAAVSAGPAWLVEQGAAAVHDVQDVLGIVGAFDRSASPLGGAACESDDGARWVDSRSGPIAPPRLATTARPPTHRSAQGREPVPVRTAGPPLAEPPATVLAALKALHGPIHIDQLVEKTTLSAQAVSAALFDLELRGLAKRVGPGLYAAA
jgi:DNA processing protein